MPTLAEALDNQARKVAEVAPPEVLHVFGSTIDTARAATGAALGVGDIAPDFVLPSATGVEVSLADLLEDGPVVVSFYRGGWCPFCNLELRALQEALPELTASGGSLVAISPQTSDESLSTAEKAELDFAVLSDVGNESSRRYGLVYRLDDAAKQLFEGFGNDLTRINGTDSWELPVPATYVVAPDRTIRWAHVDPDYRHRAEPRDVIDAVRAITAEVSGSEQ